ncbi:MAG TPA: hypothetical protein VMV36_05950 [Ignavibacteriaceae bacterium]|nr:hypothetical protein [Ignavibacteriaceae bacterium]
MIVDMRMNINGFLAEIVDLGYRVIAIISKSGDVKEIMQRDSETGAFTELKSSWSNITPMLARMSIKRYISTKKQGVLKCNLE